MSSIQSHSTQPRIKPAEIEQEIDEVRQRLDRTVDALGNLLSPGELIDQALGMARQHGGEFGRNLGAQAKNHPVPLLLAGVGLTWFITVSSRYSGSQENRPAAPNPRSDSVQSGVTSNSCARPGNAGTNRRNIEKTSADQCAKDDIASTKDGLVAAKEEIAEHYHNAAYRVGDTLQSAREAIGARSSSHAKSARNKASRLQDGFQDLLHEQPLMIGALGLAVGAALGAMLPRQETKNGLMGSSCDHTQERGQNKASADREHSSTKKDTLPEVPAREP